MPASLPGPALSANATAASALDDALIERAIAGDGAAFESLMRRHNQLLYRTARSILKDNHEAEETVQDAYLRAWRALADFRRDSKLSTWLVRITVNEALGRLRRQHSAEVIPLENAMTAPDADIQAALTADPGLQPEQQAERSQLRALLETRIDRLPERYRTVFMLRAVEELSVEDTAAALDLPEGLCAPGFSARAACCAKAWQARSIVGSNRLSPSMANAATRLLLACLRERLRKACVATDCHTTAPDCVDPARSKYMHTRHNQRYCDRSGVPTHHFLSS